MKRREVLKTGEPKSEPGVRKQMILLQLTLCFFVDWLLAKRHNKMR